MEIRRASPGDRAAIWGILEAVIRAGETYALDRELGEEEALAYWLDPAKGTFVAEEAGEILGTYNLRPNQAGGGSHVCNCGYMTAPRAARPRRRARHVPRFARPCAQARLSRDAVQLRREHQWTADGVHRSTGIAVAFYQWDGR